MIANEGYTPLALMREQQYGELDKQAKEYLLETSSSFLMLTVKRPDDVVRQWLLNYCADALYITDGINRPVRISPYLIMSIGYHVDLNAERWSGDKDNIPEIPKSLSRRFHFCKPLKDEWIDEFNHFAEQALKSDNEKEKEICNIECKNLLYSALAEMGSTRPYLFVEDHFLSITLDLFDYLNSLEHYNMQLKTSDEVFEHAKMLRKFEGYFLVTPDEKAGTKWSTYCASIGKNEIQEYRMHFDDQEVDKFSGRPRKQETAFLTYRSIFPNGHSGYIWQQVEALVSKKMGEPVSAQTIKAAIKSNEKTGE